jgi:hypothetical protein
MKHAFAYGALLLVITLLAWNIYTRDKHGITANSVSVIEPFGGGQATGRFEIPLMPKTSKKYSRVLTDHPASYPDKIKGQIFYWVLDEPFTVEFKAAGLCAGLVQDSTTKLFPLQAVKDNQIGEYVATCQVSNPLTSGNYAYDILLPNERSGKLGMASSGIRTCDGCVIDTNDYPEN